jgi:hypothetical protein
MRGVFAFGAVAVIVIDSGISEISSLSARVSRVAAARRLENGGWQGRA